MDNTRLFLFAALVFVGMLLWQQWQADYGPQPEPVSQSQSDVASTQANPETLADDLPDLVDMISTESATGSLDSSSQTVAATPSRQLVQVDTDVVRALIDTRGGVIRSVKLKQYPTSLEQPDDWLELVHSDPDSVNIVQSGLRNKAKTAPTHHSVYRVQKTAYTLEEGAAELVVPMLWNENGSRSREKFCFPTRRLPDRRSASGSQPLGCGVARL